MKTEPVDTTVDEISQRLVGSLGPALTTAIEEALAKGAPEPKPTADVGQESPFITAMNEALAKAGGELAHDQVVVVGQDGIPSISTAVQVADDIRMAELGATAIGAFATNIDQAAPLNIPAGSILVGGLSGIVAGEVIDGLVAPKGADGGVSANNILVKLGAIAVITTQGKKLMGQKSANFAVAALGVQVVSDFLPIDQWVDKIVGFVGKATGTPPAGGGTAAAVEQWLGQAGRVAQDPPNVMEMDPLAGEV